MLRTTSTAILTLVVFGQSIADRPAGAWRQYAAVEDAGFDAAALAKARAHAESSGSSAVLLVHHGRVVFAWGDPGRSYMTRSVRKSLVDLMLGTTAVQASLRLDATLADLRIDDLEPLTVQERSATVAHLLASRSGVYHPAAREPMSMTKSRPERGSARPGARWFYNNWDFNALATVYARLTGTDIVTGFHRTLAEPLGLEDYGADDGFLIREPGKSRHPAYEFPLSARDLARLGQLVVQDGRWDGRRIVSSSWLAESFRIRSPFPAGGGYGYLWWIDAGRFRAAGTPLPALDAVDDVAALGLGNQMLLVVPALQLVFVHLSANRDGSDSTPFEIADLVLQARRGDPRPGARLVDLTSQPLPNERPAPTARQAIPLPANARDYAGEYAVSPTVRAVIRHIDDGLFIDMPGRGEAELFQEAADRFFLKVVDVVVTFERDAAGVVTAARVVESGRPPLVARKVR
jgi:CubicO group peptidase (beta-lactamase class C family)